MRLNQRGNFDRVMQKYYMKYGVQVKDAKTGKMRWEADELPRVTESDLVLMQPLIITGSTLYNFFVLENQAPVLPEEIRLNLNDEFTCCEVGAFLYGTVLTEGVATAHKFWTYSPMEVTDAFIAAEDFWLGVLTMDINNVNFIDKWFVQKHHSTLQTTNQVYGTATTGASPAAFPYMEGHETGFIEMTPTITMAGSKKYKVQITCPYPVFQAGTTITVQDSTTEIVAIQNAALVLRGFNAQNAADFQTAKKKTAPKKSAGR